MGGSLDYETQTDFLLNISVTDNGVMPGPLESFTLVSIFILDRNDNPPIFTNTDVVLSVPENEQDGVVVGQVVATDADSGSNAEIFYSLADDHGRDFHSLLSIIIASLCQY